MSSVIRFGFDDALARARGIAGSIGATALVTGLSEPDVAGFFQMFGDTPRVVTLYSQGVNQSAQGTDKVNAIIIAISHGADRQAGRVAVLADRAPNAMGRARVGGSPISSPRIWVLRRRTIDRVAGSGRRRASRRMRD